MPGPDAAVAAGDAGRVGVAVRARSAGVWSVPQALSAKRLIPEASAAGYSHGQTE